MGVFSAGPDIMALAQDNSGWDDVGDAVVESPAVEAQSETEVSVEEKEAETVGEEVDDSGAPAESEAPKAKVEPIPSEKIGWAAALKALETAGQTELAAHAKRIQADATRKAQEAARERAEAAAMLAEAKALMEAAKKNTTKDPVEEELPFVAGQMKKMVQDLLAQELGPLKARQEAETQAVMKARQEAELDAWIAERPDFSSDEKMQEEVAELITSTQKKGRFIHLDDAYTVVKARRQASEQAKLQAEAKARQEAKAKAVTKTPAARPTTSTPAAPKKPARALTGAEIMALAKQM